MSENAGETQGKLSVEDIASQAPVVHPALDWTDGQLIVGVVLNGGNRAALSSTRGLIELDKVGRVCDRDGNFESHVTSETARAFVEYLKDKSGSAPADEARGVLEETAQYFRRFVIFPEEWWPEVLAVWNWSTYLFPIFQAFPYMRLTSPEPGCAKSLLGQMLANVSFNGEFMASPTEAALFHLPEQNRGTQIWDEFELSTKTEKSKFQSLKATLLNGYRNGGVVPRQVGISWETSVRFHVYCPRVLIGLSGLPEVVRQRTIELVLRKRKESQPVELYRSQIHRDLESGIRSRSYLAALKCAPRVAEVYDSEMLQKQLEKYLGSVGREVDDIWMPLFAVAAATSTKENFGIDENPLLRCLGEAAKAQAASRYGRTTEWSFSSPARSADMRAEHEKTALIAAINVLQWARGITPTELASRVCMTVGREVTPQWLTKNLARLGICSKKLRGKRTFHISTAEIRKALSRLGVEMTARSESAPRQHGHDGQEWQEIPPSERARAIEDGIEPVEV